MHPTNLKTSLYVWNVNLLWLLAYYRQNISEFLFNMEKCTYPLITTVNTSSHLHKKKLWPKKIPWPESASELYRPSDRCLSAKLVPTFADRRCNVVNAKNPYSCILKFLDWSHYYFIQVAPQLQSWGCVSPVPDSLLLRKSGSAGNRTQISGSVARSSNH
jgi:hypothetical protein